MRVYSKEDSERILADLAESGMSVNAFCSQPGRPSRHTVRKWLKQAERGELDVPERAVRGRCEHAKHERYPASTRREAVLLARKGMRPRDVARRLGVASGATVSAWVRKASGSATMAPKGAIRMDAGEAERRIAGLEAELAEANMRVDALRELMRDPKAGDPASLSNSRKAGLGERLRRDCGYRLRDVLTLLRISKSSYEYARRANERREARRSEVARRVRSAFEAGGRTYGYRRVRASIASGADGGEPAAVSEREVRRAMREGGMEARRARARRRWSSYEGEQGGRPANLPLRRDGTHDFSAPAPDRLVVTDVTEFKVGRAKVYLSPVIDCFDGCPVSWSISSRPDSELTDSSLLGYLSGLPGGHPEVAAHTDGGGTYRSRSWKRICRENGVRRSMSRKGCCPDNARAEGFFGALKEEFYYGRDWSRASPEEFSAELDGYMRWYRDGRLKLFEEGGRKVYDTIMGRRRRLGYAA